MRDPIVIQVISGDLWGGAENQCYQLCTQLKKQGITVYPILFNRGQLQRMLEDAGFEVRVWDEQTASFGEMIRRASKLLKEANPSIIHTHGPKESLIFGLGKVFARSSIKIVKTVHGGQEHYPSPFAIKKQIMRKVKGWTDKCLVNHLIAVSPELERKLAIDFTSNKVTKIINAIDCSNLPSPADIPGENKTTDSTLRLGMFARLVNVKRHDLAITALSLLDNTEIASFGTVELHIYGEGPLEKQLIDLSESLELDRQVLFHGFTANPTSAMRSIDAMIMPSDHEGTPMALLECLALGIPVIGHNVGGIKDLLEITGFGIPVDQHTSQGYATGIKEFAKEASDLLNKQEKALQSFKQHYDINAMCSKHIELYERLGSPTRCKDGYQKRRTGPT